MPPRANNKRKKGNDDDEEDFHFSSQDSLGSDDHQLQQELAKQFLVAKEKKKKEKEKKFLAAAARHLAKEKDETTSVLQALHAELNAEYHKFVMEHSAIGDHTRKILEGIREEYEKMAALAEKRHRVNEKSNAAREAAHIRAISKVRQACIDTQSMIEHIQSNK